MSSHGNKSYRKRVLVPWWAIWRGRQAWSGNLNSSSVIRDCKDHISDPDYSSANKFEMGRKDATKVNDKEENPATSTERTARVANAMVSCIRSWQTGGRRGIAVMITEYCFLWFLIHPRESPPLMDLNLEKLTVSLRLRPVMYLTLSTVGGWTARVKALAPPTSAIKPPVTWVASSRRHQRTCLGWFTQSWVFSAESA